MKFRWKPNNKSPQDAEVARLAAKADAILVELEVVVKAMSTKLREDPR